MMNLRIIFFFILIISLVLPTGYGLADTSNFIVSVQGGDDLIPPTTPTLLTADPVGATQIDITWSAETDDVYLAGYVLRRDGVAIATTTLTSYIDTGLSPETLYSYDVYAYDGFANISTISNSLATTTLATPVVITPTSTPSTGSATLVFKLLDFNLEADLRSVDLSWQTSKPSRYTLRWGRSQDYETGFVVNDIYRQNQKTTITDLEPGTTYLYELIGYDTSGREYELKRGQFKTKALEYVSTVNIQSLEARVQGEDVYLEWLWPQVAVGSKVRLVRSYYGYPTDLYDGALVYEGTGTSVLDQGALAEAQTQFYTAFLILPDGSVSSGAVVRVSKREVDEAVGTTTDPVIELPDIDIPDFIFSTDSIRLLQGSQSVSFSDSDLELYGSEAFVISIAKDSLPDHLKSIVVTITDPTNHNRSFSFLLRINKDLTAYEATIAPLESFGSSRIVVEIFDYQRLVVGRYQKGVQFVPKTEVYPEVVFPDQIIKTAYSWVAAVFAFGILSIWFFWRRYRAEDKR